MSKRKRKKPPAPAKFKVGDRIRVRHGVCDEEHSDIPLGGWTATIIQVQRGGTYCVRWSRETLANIHPIYKKRCAIEGMVFEEYWLLEDDMELDPGGPLALEQPTQITPRPLSAGNQGDRVRMIFGLTSDDYLPAVEEDSLETYYDHLAEKMSLPVEARICPQEDFFSPSPFRRVKIVALDRELGWNEEDGILCKINTKEGEEVAPLTDLELRRSDPNYQLVDDFAAWFFGDLLDDTEDDNESGDEEEQEEDDELDVENFHRMEATWRVVGLSLLRIVAFAVSFGAVVGAAVAAMPWARWAACIGGCVWGLFVAVVHAASSEKEMSHIWPKFRKGLGGFIGLIIGMIQGALFGIMVVAFIGATLGGIVGLVLRRIFRGKKWLILRVFPEGVLFSAACGVAAQAFYLNRVAATNGLWSGALIGLGCGLLFCLVSLPLAFFSVKKL